MVVGILSPKMLLNDFKSIEKHGQSGFAVHTVEWSDDCVAAGGNSQKHGAARLKNDVQFPHGDEIPVIFLKGDSITSGKTDMLNRGTIDDESKPMRGQI